MPRSRIDFPISLAKELRARGYSYEMIAWKLRKDLDIEVSKWTVMRRLRTLENSSSVEGV